MDTPVVPVGGMDSETQADIPTVVTVDRENSDYWRMGFLVEIGLDLENSGTAHFPRTEVVWTDRGRNLVGDSPVLADILVRFGMPRLDSQVVGSLPFGRWDWR